MDESFTLEEKFLFLVAGCAVSTRRGWPILCYRGLTPNTVAACVIEYMETEACVAT